MSPDFDARSPEVEANVMGDAPATMTALRVAEQIHGQLTGPDLAASAFGYAESQFRFHVGDALTRLGDTTAARAQLERALELCGPDDYTDWAMIRLDCAQRSSQAARVSTPCSKTPPT